jgi:iron complex outermembrane receptor protein
VGSPSTEGRSSSRDAAISESCFAKCAERCDHALRRPGSPSHVSIRGSSASEVLVIVNGAPINSAITGDADVSSLGLERAERVQVTHGCAVCAVRRTRAGRRRSRRNATRRARVCRARRRPGAWGERNASFAIGQTREDSAVRAAASITADYRDVPRRFLVRHS